MSFARMTLFSLVVSALFASQPAALSAAERGPASTPYDTYTIKSYQDLLDIFARYNYTAEAWDKGVRDVPRLKYAFIPKRWATNVSNEISVSLKKELFFRALAPLVLIANERIMDDRKAMLKLIQQDKADHPDLMTLAQKYRIVGAERNKLTPQQLAELKKRVDLVPLSLVLAQGAEESGWGTSRFAIEGNALFGQWTWGGKGITPKGQRKALGNYKIAAFDTPMGSVTGYLQNLNTNKAYASLRDRRASLRDHGQPITGMALADSLINYSERGQAYVDGLKSMMRINHLAEADKAKLMNMAPIMIRPAGPGAR